LKFHKRGQLFIATQGETFSVVATRPLPAGSATPKPSRGSLLFEIARVPVPVRPGSLVQQRGKLVAVVAVVTVAPASYYVFGRLQVTDFDFGDFLLHFNFPF
jgi:hypothetical protein